MMIVSTDRQLISRACSREGLNEDFIVCGPVLHVIGDPFSIRREHGVGAVRRFHLAERRGLLVGDGESPERKVRSLGSLKKKNILTGRPRLRGMRNTFLRPCEAFGYAGPIRPLPENAEISFT